MIQTARLEMPKKATRLQIPSIGEWYEDLLKVDATINDRSEPQQASSLLCAKLQEREPRIKQRVEYLAAKRGVPFQQMWDDIVTGNFEKLTADEFAELRQAEKKDA
ncbi:MAG: hypothetical protein ACFB4J_15290 [Elainellaceae cyanobacterium]